MVKYVMKDELISNAYDVNAKCVLHHGNCLELLRFIPDNTIKLVVTSPPYNLGKEYESKTKLDDYLNFQKQVIRECVRTLSMDGSICWEVGNYVDNGRIIPLDYLLFPIFNEFGLKMRNRIIWHYGHGLHASKRLSGRYEVIMWFTKSDTYTFNLDSIRVPSKYSGKKYYKGAKKGQFSCNPLGKNPSDVWDIPNVKSNHIEKTCHPCQYPVELIERLVLALTNKGDKVLDPFMGVGSTAIAALMHGREAIGAEIKKDYVDLAKDRIKNGYNGELLIRPLNRPIYDPNNSTKNIPSQKVNLSIPIVSSCTSKNNIS
jgi:adenine-specific DNA-methyltransferase